MKSPNDWIESSGLADVARNAAHVVTEVTSMAEAALRQAQINRDSSVAEMWMSSYLDCSDAFIARRGSINQHKCKKHVSKSFINGNKPIVKSSHLLVGIKPDEDVIGTDGEYNIY